MTLLHGLKHWDFRNIPENFNSFKLLVSICCPVIVSCSRSSVLHVSLIGNSSYSH
ncbi:unnamed protein product [Gongylonema pulchrum]|uniref:Ovule protein n=1 Tax=Gongylonema pulchrum TaxID=637853 RepID=A0A183DJT9_9BILA|nr:unnamed protein product [Gongylonema pulchrum]